MRKYYWEIENEYGVVFPMLKKQLKGKKQDGITAAQKKWLWANGVNVSGIKYKGSAMAITSFIIDLKQKQAKPKNMFQVKYRKENGLWYFSKRIFRTESEAEYEIAKNIPPEYDVKLIPYFDAYWQTVSGRCFASRASAHETGENYFLFVCR